MQYKLHCFDSAVTIQHWFKFYASKRDRRYELIRLLKEHDMRWLIVRQKDLKLVQWTYTFQQQFLKYDADVCMRMYVYVYARC